MINFIIFNFSFVIILFVSTFTATSEDFNADTILARVNEKNITLGHIIAAVTRLPEEYNSLEPDYLLEGILDQIVKQEIMAQALDISEKSTKVMIENEIRSIKAKYAIEKKINTIPTPDDIETAYNEIAASITATEEFNASHILVDTKESALELIELLKKDVDFKQLAKEKSTGPSGSNGGQLGWFGLGQMVPEFETAMANSEEGEVTEPFRSEFGWHILEVKGRRDKDFSSQVRRNQVAGFIREQKYQEELDAWLRKIREEAFVDIK